MKPNLLPRCTVYSWYGFAARLTAYQHKDEHWMHSNNWQGRILATISIKGKDDHSKCSNNWLGQNLWNHFNKEGDRSRELWSW